jgi:methyl-accepting chemotaxis protein
MKLQTKILFPVLTVIILLTVSLSFLYNFFIGKSVQKEFNKRGAIIASSLASTGRLGVLMHDSTQLGTILNAMMVDKDLRYAAFLEENGRVIVKLGVRPLNQELSGSSKESHYEAQNSVGEKMEMFSSKVFSRADNSEIIGSVEIAISKEVIISERRMTIVWSAVLCVIFSIISGFTVIVIMKMLKPLIEGIRLVATGDLSLELKPKNDDEVGELIRSLDTFICSLRGIVEEVEQSTVYLSEHAIKISSDSASMAAGTQEQTRQAIEVASAMEEMTKTITENSRNATETANTAKIAKNAAEDGGKVVQDTVIGMKRIADVVEKSAATVDALGKSSNQIGQIINVIDDIADQTSLLALNAAIEAARAGEHGRGFAVVADEVRKLAERTTKATKEIANMITVIQTETRKAVESMEDGTKEVTRGIELADRAGASLNQIVQISQRVTDMISQIAAASDQQSKAIEHIAINVESISKVARQTADGTQQIAHATEDLNVLTERLNQLVKKFNISKKSDNPKFSTVAARNMKSKISVKHNGTFVDDNKYS